jgi:outer membrane protein assembly factor BamB
MISAEQFLAALEEKDLIPKPLVESLRRQLAQAKSPISAMVLAKKLVEKGQLTPVQAKRILESPPPAAKAPSPPADDDFGLAPLEEPKPLAPEPQPPLGGGLKRGVADAGKRSMKDSAQVSRPSKLAAPIGDIKADLEKGGLSAAEKPATPAKPAVKPPTASFLDQELAPLGAGAGDVDDYGVADAAPPPPKAEAPKPAEAAPAKPAATPAPKTAAPAKGKPAKAAEKEKKPEKLAKAAKPMNPKLLAIGGGVLVVLLAVGGAAAWFLTRPTGDEDLQAAEADFQGTRYAQAVEKYNAFLTQFPQHKDAGLARVHRGVAQLKLATAGSDYRASLNTAKQVLGEMAAQPEFGQAGNELAVMLPSIADGLARLARKNPETGALNNARESLALAKRYVPREARKPAQLAELELSLALTARDLARPAELEKGLAEIRQAVGQRKFSEAYARRSALLKSYPEAADQAGLREATAAIGQAEKAAVQWTDKKQPAQTSEGESPILGSAVPFGRSVKSTVPGADGQVAFVVANGSAYALDAAGGKLLWQRFVGVPVDGRGDALLPVAVGSDCVLADLPGQAVVRVEATTGKLRWRQTLEQPVLGRLAVAGNRVLAATRAGRVYYLDADSGAMAGYAQLPQPLAVGLAAAADKGLVFALAEQASLYVLSATDGKCKQVIAVGYEPGSIAAEPAVAGSLLMLATNDLLDDANFRVLAIGVDAAAPLRMVQTERVKGHVDASPSAVGSRVAVATDRGAVYLFDAAGAEEGKLKSLAEVAPEGPESVARYALLQPDKLWVGGAQLTRYGVAGDGRFEGRQTSDLDSAFLQTPMGAGGAVICVRRCGAVPGARVTAVNPADDSAFWEAHVGAPLAELLAADGAVAGVTAAGVAFRVDPAAIKGQTVAEQTVLPSAEQLVGPVTGAAALEGGLLAYAGQGSRSLWLFDPKAGEKAVRRVALADAMPTTVTAFAGGAVVPGRLGQVALVDVKGDKLAEPFQPLLPGGTEFAWRRGAAAGGTLVVSDGRAKLYAVQRQNDPKPHLAQTAEVQSGVITTPVAMAGQIAYAADASGTLAPYGLPKLERGQTWPLGSRCVWGPCAVGKRVLAATAAGKLLCLDDQAKLAWQVDLPAGPPAGTPIEASGAYLLATRRGQVLKIDAASGKSSAKLELGRPLASGPVSLGGRMFVGGADGTLYEIKPL